VTSSGGSGVLISKITDLREDGFTEKWDTYEAAIAKEWFCQAEGLVDLNQQDGVEVLSVVMEDAEITGTSGLAEVSIPYSISVGDTWSQTYTETSSEKGYEGTKVNLFEEVDFIAVGGENVNVPAGTFTAMKVGISAVSDYVLDSFRRKIHLCTNTDTTTNWIVGGIGLIKSGKHAVLEVWYIQNMK